MDNNESAMFDDFIDMVKKDPASMDGILADNEDMRDELEPVLRAALWLDGIEHPEMMPEQKRRYRQSAVLNNPEIPENLWVDMPIHPHPNAPGDQSPQ
ncbi:MAG: hypothetical protein JW738_08865 [Actinobacteria bacterium]|nr:hypothetical protein [Actinomycetota bacterium]